MGSTNNNGLVDELSGKEEHLGVSGPQSTVQTSHCTVPFYLESFIYTFILNMDFGQVVSIMFRAIDYSGIGNIWRRITHNWFVEAGN